MVLDIFRKKRVKFVEYKQGFAFLPEIMLHKARGCVAFARFLPTINTIYSDWGLDKTQDMVV